jgi:hypothetical protein
VSFKFCGKCGHELSQPITAESITAPPSPTKIPISFADGRQETKEFLGAGGKKKVFKAYDTLLDREVALDLIKIEGLDEDSKTRITREANQAEIWYNIITQEAIRRGTFRSVKNLTEKIKRFIDQYSRNSKPFMWTATPDSILAKIERLCRVLPGQ